MKPTDTISTPVSSDSDVTPALDTIVTSASSSSTAAVKSLRKEIKNVYMNGKEVSALMYCGSSYSFMHPRLSTKLSLCIDYNKNQEGSVKMVDTLGHCNVQLKGDDRSYPGQKLYLMDDLCLDIILGLDSQTLIFNFNGPEPPIELDDTEVYSICGLAQM